jgi:hypothetical protein
MTRVACATFLSMRIAPLYAKAVVLIRLYLPIYSAMAGQAFFHIGADAAKGVIDLAV